MCGISGILAFDGGRIDPRQIDAMNNILRHRGPDDGGIYCDGPIGLGNRRLSIFDTSAEGHQPMHSASGRFVITLNGSIYNWPEIRRKLKFDKWHSQSDTETIVEAYAELGLRSLSLLNGMFAFAIWDREERSLLLVRDRIGIKPLFVGTGGGRLLFASEVKAMAVAGHPISPNEGCVWDFLRWGLVDHGQETFFKNVRHLEPGTWMKIHPDKRISEGRYWDLVEIVNSRPPIPVGEAIEQYADGLRTSIALNCRSDVPVCAFISSGVDSAILLSFMAQSNTKNVKNFTYDFSDGDTGELEGARELAGLFGVDHGNAILEASEVPKYFEKALWHEEYPITSIRVLAYLKLYERARSEGYIVILDGNGGDQTGGGFEYYFLSIVMDKFIKEGPGAGIDLFNQFMDLYKVPTERRLERLLGCMAATLTPGVCTQDGVPFVRPEFFSADFRNRHGDRRPAYPRPFDSHLLNSQYVDLMVHNQRRVLRMNDRTSMAVACEQREPILDHNLVELGFGSAAEARVKGTDQRHYMREAAKKLLPEKILRRPKRAIVDPQRKWLKEELREWVGDAIHSEAFASCGVFDVDAARTEFAEYCSFDGIPPTGFHIFQFVNIAHWYERIANGQSFQA